MANNISYAGTYFIELPQSITDEMFIKRTPYVNNILFELIKSKLEGQNDNIAVVIFTRDEEPVKPIIPEIKKSMENPSKLINSLGPPLDNDLKFVFRDDFLAWEEKQKEDVVDFLYSVESDDHQAFGIYNSAKKLYGPPFFDVNNSNYGDY